MTEIGWKEIETKVINIRRPYTTKIFSTAGEWVEFTTRRPMLDNNGRNHCQCCRIKWTELDKSEATYLLFTDKGNKVVCQKCYDSFDPKKINP